jgi:hypothetical protein
VWSVVRVTNLTHPGVECQPYGRVSGAPALQLRGDARRVPQSGRGKQRAAVDRSGGPSRRAGDKVQGDGGAGLRDVVGLYRLTEFSLPRKSAWFQPLNLSSDFLVSNLAFKFNLHRYNVVRVRGGVHGGVGARRRRGGTEAARALRSAGRYAGDSRAGDGRRRGGALHVECI